MPSSLPKLFTDRVFSASKCPDKEFFWSDRHQTLRIAAVLCSVHNMKLCDLKEKVASTPKLISEFGFKTDNFEFFANRKSEDNKKVESAVPGEGVVQKI